ncbi:MAG: alpha/beta hydrolase [Proteobacteria bacterium]|nr:alpha/beta hydrolase [Pseudomonadota bacterium]
MSANINVDFVMSARAVKNGAFVADVAKTARFLQVPLNADPLPDQAIPSVKWYDAVQAAGRWTNPMEEERGDILFIVHGYNESQHDVMDRHRRIKSSLATVGFKGVVVSFDWPSGDNALAYLADRERARACATMLVNDAIRQLSARQTPDCMTNIHVLGHSTGAFVIREAFDHADDTLLPQQSWMVSQILFAAGDISSASMSSGNPSSQSLFNHCVRLTNYCSSHDIVLDISNVKRIGVAPRVGRVGLPVDASPAAVNVDCSVYYAQLESDPSVQQQDEPGGIPDVQSHSWYFGNLVFARDVLQTIIGIESQNMPTRTVGADGKLSLARPAK